ncbi:MAG: hypothetical protein ACRDK4_13335 [Solirubrobacteraceae bacterium]
MLTALITVFAVSEEVAKAGKSIGLGVGGGLGAVGAGVGIGIILFAFEVSLVAALQAFIFATLTAIYLGGAVAAEH